MTMIVAFRSDTHAFIVADSAITSAQSDGLLWGPASSFEERHPVGANGTVEEAALKILRVGDDAWGFAGDVTAIEAAAARIKKLRTEKRPTVREAIAIEFSSVAELELELVWVYFEEGSPRVESWSVTSGWEESIFAVAGSAAHNQELVGTCYQLALRTVAPTHGLPLDDYQLEPSVGLTLFQAGLQAVSVQENLIIDGVGGGLIGAMVGPAGFEWQADQCHVLFEGGALAAGAAGDPSRFAVRSTIVRDGFAFVHPVLNLAGEWETRCLLPLGRTAKPSRGARRSADKVLREGRYELMTLMRTRTCTPYVLHAAGRRTAEFFLLDPASKDLRLRRWIVDLVERFPSFETVRYGVAISLVVELADGGPPLTLLVSAHPQGSDWRVLTTQ